MPLRPYTTDRVACGFGAGRSPGSGRTAGVCADNTAMMSGAVIKPITRRSFIDPPASRFQISDFRFHFRLRPDFRLQTSDFTLRSSLLLRREKRARQALEQRRQRLSIERERARIRHPRQLIASGHGRHPDLPDRVVRRHDESRVGRFLEDEVQHAVLQFDFERCPVREREQRTLCGFERIITSDAKFLFAQRAHARCKPLPRPTRLSVWKAGEGTMRDWSFSGTAEWVVGLLLAVVIVA